MFGKLKELILYHPEQDEREFVLGEYNERGDNRRRIKAEDIHGVLDRFREVIDEARATAELIGRLRRDSAEGALPAAALAAYRDKLAALEKRRRELEPLLLAYEHGDPFHVRRYVAGSLAENKRALGKTYHLPRNKDLMLRDFTLPGPLPRQVTLAYMDGMVDKQLIATAVLKPLMLQSCPARPDAAQLPDMIAARFLPHIQVKPATAYQDVLRSINAGDGVLFIDGVNTALTLDIKGYKARGIERAQIEITTRGSQASFSEVMRINTGYLRAMLQSADLVTEIIPIGKVSPKNCAVLYMANIANPALRREMVRRLKNLDVDAVFDAGALSQLLTSNHWQIPQAMSTERPDRAVANLLDGRIVLMLDGDPFVYIMPVNLWDFFQNTSDYSLRTPASFFMRSLRYAGALISIVLPGFYVALLYFHHDAIPTELALAISGYRYYVPFPSVVAMGMMILAFELIREATLRVPGQLGGSIGIVGAIILGQAAVTAKIVSPLMVVIVAITGLASYVIPEYRMAFAIRITQYALLAGGALLGLVGMSIVLFLLMVELTRTKSLGMPFLTPVAPRTATVSDILAAPRGKSAQWRPDALNPLRPRKQGPPQQRSKDGEDGKK